MNKEVLQTKESLQIQQPVYLLKPVEKLSQKEMDGKEQIIEALSKSNGFVEKIEESGYKRFKKELREHQSWYLLYFQLGEDFDHLDNIFVRLAEEESGTLINSASMLQEITGIYEDYMEWDEEKEKLFHNAALTKKEAQTSATECLENAFLTAMRVRYMNTLRALLEDGCKYKQLFQINPAEFYLSETDQQEQVRWALICSFGLGDSSVWRPDQKAIAEAIEAPLSVILDASYYY